MESNLILKSAKELIAAYHFPADAWEDLEEGQYYNGKYTDSYETMDATILSDSLQYFIKVQTKRLNQEADLELGASKKGGLPHFPALWEWPGSLEFYAQLNMKDIKPLDIEDVFPDEGIIYFFIAEDDPEHAKILFYTGSVTELEVKSNHEDVSVGSLYRLNFTPGAIFCIEEDSYGLYANVDELIPTDLEKELNTLLGCKLTSDEPDGSVLGRPKFWQSEDVSYEEDDNKHRKAAKTGENRILIFQDSFGEGNIHFWAEKALLKLGNFENAYVTASGT